MTLSDAYIKAKEILRLAGIDSFSMDAQEILQFALGLATKHDFILHSKDVANEKSLNKFFDLINQRALGKPLQYILGKWTFMDIELEVGKGVLIPREDTETLVNEALAFIKKIKKPKILELCGGSGAISIAISKYNSAAKIFSIEVSDIALGFFKKNMFINEIKNVSIIKADVFSNPKDILSDQQFDLIVSNPPYIKTSDINILQKEVLFEPKLALDGGFDGLKFYREFANNWIQCLKPNGSLMVEVGINQATDVADIFRNGSLKNISFVKDLNGIDRVVKAIK